MLSFRHCHYSRALLLMVICFMFQHNLVSFPVYLATQLKVIRFTVWKWNILNKELNIFNSCWVNVIWKWRKNLRKKWSTATLVDAKEAGEKTIKNRWVKLSQTRRHTDGSSNSLFILKSIKRYTRWFYLTSDLQNLFVPMKCFHLFLSHASTKKKNRGCWLCSKDAIPFSLPYLSTNKLQSPIFKIKKKRLEMGGGKSYVSLYNWCLL